MRVVCAFLACSLSNVDPIDVATALHGLNQETTLGERTDGRGAS